MKKFIIEFLSKKEIFEILDDKAIDIINYYLRLNSLSHPETRLDQDDDHIQFQVTKEYMEQWIVQAIGGTPMGAGSYPIDVKTKSFLADIKSMSIKVDKNGDMNNSESGETSLGQKFSEPNLDDMFVNNEFENIKNLWVKILSEKYNKSIEDTKIDKIIYIFFMRAKDTYYIFIARLNYDLITKENISVNLSRTTNSSVFLSSFIDNSLGSAKIYKAKKRLELRLKPKKIVENGDFLKLNILDWTLGSE